MWYVCMCMNVYMCVGAVCVYVGWYLWKPQGWCGESPLMTLPSIASQRAPLIPSWPSEGRFRSRPPCSPSIYMSSRDPSSSTPVYIVGISTAKPSPQHLMPPNLTTTCSAPDLERQWTYSSHQANYLSLYEGIMPAVSTAKYIGGHQYKCRAPMPINTDLSQNPNTNCSSGNTHRKHYHCS